MTYILGKFDCHTYKIGKKDSFLSDERKKCLFCYVAEANWWTIMAEVGKTYRCSVYVGVGLDKFEHNFEIHGKIMKTWYFGVCNEKWAIMF
jgi:hypothetical protein